MGFERCKFNLTLLERIRAFLMGTYSVRMWKVSDDYELKLKESARKQHETH